MLRRANTPEHIPTLTPTPTHPHTHTRTHTTLKYKECTENLSQSLKIFVVGHQYNGQLLGKNNYL